MKIKVIGKVHREGTSKKTGAAYDFLQVHCNGPDRGVEGLATLVLNLDPSLIPYADIKLNAEYEVDFGHYHPFLRHRPAGGGADGSRFLRRPGKASITLSRLL